jgi:hypothetical protein
MSSFPVYDTESCFHLTDTVSFMSLYIPIIGCILLLLTLSQDRQIIDLVAITPQQRAMWVEGLKQVCVVLKIEPIS